MANLSSWLTAAAAWAEVTSVVWRYFYRLQRSPLNIRVHSFTFKWLKAYLSTSSCQTYSLFTNIHQRCIEVLGKQRADLWKHRKCQEKLLKTVERACIHQDIDQKFYLRLTKHPAAARSLRCLRAAPELPSAPTESAQGFWGLNYFCFTF